MAGREEILWREHTRCLAAVAPDGKTLAVLHPGSDGKMMLSLLRRAGA